MSKAGSEKGGFLYLAAGRFVLATSTEIEDITDKFLLHNEDVPDRNTEASSVSMSEHVSKCIQVIAGLTSTAGMANIMISSLWMKMT